MQVKRFRPVVVAVISILFVACGKKNDPGEENPPPGPVVYTGLFRDTLYKNGFTLGHVEDGTPGVAAILTYGGTTADNPVWSIGQWNNYNNNLKEASFTGTAPAYAYETAHGTALRVNTQEGSVQLELNTTSEYGHSEVCPVNPRRATDKWPHLLLACDLLQEQVLKIAGKQEILMDIDFTIDGIADEIPAGTYDPDLHAAQFQWFITVQNRNMQDDGFGEYFWFGLSFYDTRHEFSPHYSAQDGNTTGMFIYMPDMKDLLATTGKTEIGKDMRLSVNVLPVIETAFEVAKSRGYMQKTEKGDLHIASTNVGWEVPGTYNVAATIRKLNIRYR